MNPDQKIAEYRERAQKARQQAQNTNWESQREAHRRSAAKWEEEADKVEMIQRMEVKNDEAVAEKKTEAARKHRIDDLPN